MFWERTRLEVSYDRFGAECMLCLAYSHLDLLVVIFYENKRMCKRIKRFAADYTRKPFEK